MKNFEIMLAAYKELNPNDRDSADLIDIAEALEEQFGVDATNEFYEKLCK